MSEADKKQNSVTELSGGETKTKNIVLIGFMGTGKTAVGRALAQITHRPRYDVDMIIEQEVGESVADYLNRVGESEFRKKESDVVRRLSAAEGVIISTGGGAPTVIDNIVMLKKNGVIVLLTASLPVIIQRVQPYDTRPLLANSPDPEQKIQDLLKERDPYYLSAADITVSTDNRTTYQIAQTIINMVERK